MTNDNGSPQKMVSTPTLIFLVVALAVLGYMLLQPMFAPDSSGSVAKQPVADNQPPAAATGDNYSDAAIQQQASNNEVLTVAKNGTVSNRDPFLPSALVYVKRDITNSEPQPVLDLKPEPPKKTEPESTSKTEAANLTWKGLVGAETDQLVMIQRNNRTYSLRLGDILPGTQFILSEVTSDSILLISPTEQKRLYKKKEAKKNG